MKIFLTILLTFLSVNAFAQSSQVVAPTTSSDCQSVSLTDAAGTTLGPYTKNQVIQRWTSALSQRERLLEQVAQEDAQLAASSIAIGALNACVVPVVLTTNVNWDSVALLSSQGVNWTDIKASQAGINWPAVDAMNGINWALINKANINWSNWPVAEASGLNWPTWINNGGN